MKPCRFVVALLIFICILNYLSFNAVAAINSKTSLSSILLHDEDQSLELLKQRGPAVYEELRGVAFNDKKTMGLRWRAFMAMVKIGEKQSIPEVELALKNENWYLRDAALRVLPVLDSKLAYTYATQKLKDSALLVRTTAVDTLAKLNRPESAKSLWSQLYSKENYMKKKSLWIRRHIVEALAKVAPVGNESQFIKILDDEDTTLIAPAIAGLERLTHKHFGDYRTSLNDKRNYWRQWFELNHTP